MRPEPMELAIVGAGAAGLAAAVRAAADGLGVTLLERGTPGGHLLGTARCEAVPGHPVGMSGAEMAERSLAQATRFGAALRADAEAVALREDAGLHALDLADGSTVHARAVIVATGTDLPELPVPGLREFRGSGVYLGVPAAPAEALRSREVVVVGEPAAAADAALRLAEYCRSVVIAAPGRRVAAGLDERRAERLRAALNVSVRLCCELVEAVGVERIETLILRDRRSGRITAWPAAALFLVGLETPRTAWLASTLRLAEGGFIATGEAAGAAWSLGRAALPHETGLPGVFAAGGVRAGAVRSPAGSIEEGIAAARQASEYLRGRAAAHRSRTGAAPECR